MTNPDQNLVATIKQQIAEHPVLLYMKGSPEMPRCGFSARAVEILAEYDQAFVYVDILEHPDIRATLPQVADWPTFPQLYIKGELVGGSDIILELHQNGALQQLMASIAEQPAPPA